MCVVCLGEVSWCLGQPNCLLTTVCDVERRCPSPARAELVFPVFGGGGLQWPRATLYLVGSVTKGFTRQHTTFLPTCIFPRFRSPECAQEDHTEYWPGQGKAVKFSTWLAGLHFLYQYSQLNRKQIVYASSQNVVMDPHLMVNYILTVTLHYYVNIHWWKNAWFQLVNTAKDCQFLPVSWSEPHRWTMLPSVWLLSPFLSVQEIECISEGYV